MTPCMMLGANSSAVSLVRSPSDMVTGGLGKEALAALLRQFRNKSATGDSGPLEGVPALDLNIVQTAMGRLGTYEQFRQQSERTYRDRAAAVALKPKDQLQYKNEELVGELQSLRAKLARRNAAILDLRTRLNVAIMDASFAATGVLHGQHGQIDAAAAHAAQAHMQTHPHKQPRAHAQAQHPPHPDHPRDAPPALMKAHNEELLTLSDELHSLQATIQKHHANTFALEKKAERDATRAREALYRSEQRVVQLFERARSLEKDNALLGQTVQLREMLVHKLQLQLETRGQEILDSELRSSELGAHLQAALADGESLAQDLLAATTALDRADEDKKAAVEDGKKLMDQVNITLTLTMTLLQP